MEYGGYDNDSEKKKRKQHCTYCTNHGKKSRKTNHKCEHETCECLLCKLTRLSRLIMRHQQRLWRHLKDTKRREDASLEHQGRSGSPTARGAQGGAAANVGVASSTKQQKCDMCRNHGEITSKRAHKNACPYQKCTCALCTLTRKRRDIMRHQQRVRRSQVMSKQHNEAWKYVIQAELEFFNMKQAPPTTDENEAFSSSASGSPSPTGKSMGSPTSVYIPLKSEAVPSTPVSPPTLPKNAKKQLSSSVTPEMPPLELLPECSPPRYSPVHTLPPTIISSRPSDPMTPPEVVPPIIAVRDMSVMDCEPTWKSPKKEREEAFKLSQIPAAREENLLNNLDFMRGYQTSAGRLEPLVPSFHDTPSAMEYSNTHMPPFKSFVSMIDTSRLPSTQLKKMRADENFHLQYNHMLFRSFPVEPRPEELQAHHYQRAIMNASSDLRMRSPPGLIPIHQPQTPLRPRPVTPLRPHTFHSSMNWDFSPLHPLSFLINSGSHYSDTLPTPSTFGFPRDAPFLHPPVP